MAFSDAIPVNAADRSRERFGVLGERADRSDRTGPKAVQSVNISEAAVNRFAREKLRGALTVKLGYNRLGALGSEDTVGQHISERV